VKYAIARKVVRELESVDAVVKGGALIKGM
jgi:hypothetical protein